MIDFTKKEHLNNQLIKGVFRLINKEQEIRFLFKNHKSSIKAVFQL